MRISDWSSDVCSSDLFSGVEFAPDAGRQKVLRIAVEICEQLNDHLLALEPSLLELRRFDDPRMDKSLQLGQEIERLGTHRRLIVEKRSEEHTSELQSLMRISYAVFRLKKKTTNIHTTY